jgi:hypothetical protein
MRRGWWLRGISLGLFRHLQFLLLVGFSSGARGLRVEREHVGARGDGNKQVRGERGRARPRGLTPMAIPCNYRVRVWALQFSISNST